MAAVLGALCETLGAHPLHPSPVSKEGQFLLSGSFQAEGTLCIAMCSVTMIRRCMPGARGAGRGGAKASQGTFLIAPTPGVGKSKGQKFPAYCKVVRGLLEEMGPGRGAEAQGGGSRSALWPRLAPCTRRTAHTSCVCPAPWQFP